MCLSEPDLIGRAVGGDREALDELLSRYGPAVRRRMERRIHRRWQALLSVDDLMQKTYVKAIDRIGQLSAHNGRSFAAWLHRIARSTSQDVVAAYETEKRGGGRQPISLATDRDSYVALIELVARTSSTPSRAAARNEARLIIESMVEHLPPDYRQVVRLYDLEGRPAKEVAAAMKRSIGAVYMLRERAHDALGKIIGPPTNYFTDCS